LNSIALPALETNQVDLFLNRPSERLSELSHYAYRGDREAYLSFCRDKGISIGDPDSLERYKNFLLERSVKPTTINRKLCAIKAGLVGYLVAAYGREKAEVLKSAYKVVKGIKLSKNERVIRPESVLSEEEIERLIKAADLKTSLIIRFLSKTGCRISEALNITMGDVKENDDAVEISVVGKGQKGRTVFISKSDFSEILQTFKGKKYLFETIHGNRYDKVNVTKKIGKLSESTLRKHISAHTLRHSFATNMIRKTRKIQATSEYLGHSSTAITLDMYTHETLSLDELL
jgi:integrase/recombinase XerD